MEIDKTLKNELLKLITNYKESVPIHSIRNLTLSEMEKNANYIASKFMSSYSIESFRSSIRRAEDLTTIDLPEATRMHIYHNSNAILIKRNMRPLDNLITEGTDKKQLTEIAINAMKKLDIEKWKLPFEHVEFERLWQIKASGISTDSKYATEVLCRIVGAFRRHINNLPVYGRASVFVKIAARNIIEAVGIDWRFIEEKPIDTVKIIDPEIAAETIVRNLNSYLQNQSLTLDDYKPEFFSLGFFSLPKKQRQNFMQPVYVAMFKAVGWTSLNRLILVPASYDIYEPVCRTPASHIPSSQVRK